MRINKKLYYLVLAVLSLMICGLLLANGCSKGVSPTPIPTTSTSSSTSTSTSTNSSTSTSSSRTTTITSATTTTTVAPPRGSWTLRNGFGTSTFEAVAFYDDKIGWIGGQNGAVYVTTDGGDSWGAFVLSDKIGPGYETWEVRSITFNAYEVSLLLMNGAAHNCILAHGNNSGSTSLTVVPVSADVCQKICGADLSTVWFADGGVINKIIYGGSSSFMDHSPSFFQTFNIKNTFGATAGYVPNGGVSGNSVATIEMTNNSGANWEGPTFSTDVLNTFFVTWESEIDGQCQYASGTIFSAGTYRAAIGGRRQPFLIWSSNSGLNWGSRTFVSNFPSAGNCSASKIVTPIQAASPSRSLWLFLKGTSTTGATDNYLYSLDEGSTWAEGNLASHGVTHDQLNDFCFINNNLGWAVGQDGIVMKYTNP